MEFEVVADGPRGTTENGEGCCEGGPGEGETGALVGSVFGPAEEEGEQGDKGSVGHEGEPPEQTVKGPFARGIGVGRSEEAPEQSGGEERGERAFEEGFVGEDDGVREAGPEPGGSSGDTEAEHASRGRVERDAGEGGEENVEAGGGEEGLDCVGPEELEDGGEDEGVDGGHPGGGAGLDAEGVGEAVAINEGSGDIAGLKEERDGGEGSGDVVRDVIVEETHTEEERDEDDEREAAQTGQMTSLRACLQVSRKGRP